VFGEVDWGIGGKGSNFNRGLSRTSADFFGVV